ncbi:MAG: NAD(P)-dependent alcohol dehydrogenase [Gammaproteobacteria bacterium]|jgi:NADPH:quinone reductase-like Zn-dependent oxidoreductase|nr:NAD(P)-dependent alcohol dehydrogenase [Gammaproteobacteria bacterium]MDP6615988.1 NAD(P)-dependent alcohol dehydrogenase [Gammaproteobacteria bacterium]MDP6694885.1 NAD(P)-dependent alcohol dehydrogenase [Gammaproteobacteria bacterium]MDP7041367.1 NAD(P)-dependent alcohol dehydrogenase [Gammaproteobacteria bacterium]
MKAAVLDEFGPSSVIHIRDIPKPTVSDGKVLVEVHATSINPIDWKMRDGQMAARFGEDFPMVLGFDCSGVVADVAADVSGFEVGDVVFGRSDLGTGGCYAEYAEVSAGTLVKKPDQLSHEEAASIVLVGLTVINGLVRCAKAQPGQKVLIVGASGGVGTLAVQIAKNVGAHVTGVCSGKNADLVASLGADAVIDYTKENALETGPYDIVYDTVGVHQYDEARQALTEDGIYLTLVPVPGIDFFIPGQSEFEKGKGYFVAWTTLTEDIEQLAAWVREGKLRPVIDSEFTLDQIREAHERSQTERAVGKIVVRVRD